MPQPARSNLRAITSHTGIEPEQLADTVGVDIKTVERWLTGRIPYARHRRAVARALNSTEHELWPDTATAPPTAPPEPQPDPETDAGDVVSSHARADDPGVPDPVAVITRAEHRIELLGDLLTDLFSRPGLTELLDAKAAAGCQIRLFLLDPEFVRQTVLAERPPNLPEPPYWKNPAVLGSLHAQRAHGYIDDLLHHPTVQGYHHPLIGGNAIIRADDRMLVYLALPWCGATHYPVLHLHRRGPDGLFDRYITLLDQTLKHSSVELVSDPDRYPHPDQDPDRYLPLAPESQ